MGPIFVNEETIAHVKAVIFLWYCVQSARDLNQKDCLGYPIYEVQRLIE